MVFFIALCIFLGHWCVRIEMTLKTHEEIRQCDFDNDRQDIHELILSHNDFMDRMRSLEEWVDILNDRIESNQRYTTELELYVKEVTK